jgi:hypothetical protein
MRPVTLFSRWRFNGTSLGFRPPSQPCLEVQVRTLRSAHNSNRILRLCLHYAGQIDARVSWVRAVAARTGWPLALKVSHASYSTSAARRMKRSPPASAQRGSVSLSRLKSSENRPPALPWQQGRDLNLVHKRPRSDHIPSYKAHGRGDASSLRPQKAPRLRSVPPRYAPPIMHHGAFKPVARMFHTRTRRTLRPRASCY